MQFGRGCLSGAEIAPFWLWLTPPASLSLVGDGPIRSWLGLLWYSLSRLFCEWTWQCLRLGLSQDSSLSLSLSLFSFLLLALPQFGLLSHISSLRLPSWHSGPVLTLRNAACVFLFSLLLVVDVSTGSCHRHVTCGFKLSIYLFFLLVMLPSEIPKLPTDPLVRVFPSVWKLLRF